MRPETTVVPPVPRDAPGGIPDADPRVARWRAATPGCEHVTHLNNAGAALVPRRVLAAVTDHLGLEAEVGGYEAADLRADEIGRVYDELAALVGARPEHLAVVSSATAGFVQALSSFDLGPGDTIVTSRCDYTSNQIQYLALARRRGVRVVHAPDLPEGGVDPDAVRALAGRHRARLVAVSWIPTNSGLVQDVEAVGAACEAIGVPFVVDACQAVGQLPIDVARLRCDYLSATARKFLRGPRGVGFLYASDRALARGDHPLFVDMRGAVWADADRYEVDPTARRYEEWEHPYALVLGLGEAARYAREVGVELARDRAWALADHARARLAGIDGVRVLDRGHVRCAIVTAAVRGASGEDVVRALARRRINATATVRWYGIYDMDEKGVESAVRVSPHYYNTVAEVDAMVDAVREIAAAAG